MIRIVAAASALLLGCAAAPVFTPAFAQEAGEPLSAAVAQRRLEAYVHTWSTNAGVNPALISWRRPRQRLKVSHPDRQ